MISKIRDAVVFESASGSGGWNTRAPKTSQGNPEELAAPSQSPRYIARKRVEDTLSYEALYVASLSPKTIVYKAGSASRGRQAPRALTFTTETHIA